ncbi:MAG TPA: hypothetical protein VLA77_01990 [Candidatus Saccharimonadales bacterium]|nr:hypothetical protein [Candidatus Saccharimonadales bacterium]
MRRIFGFSIIEVIVAIGIFTVAFAGGTTAILHSLSVNRLEQELGVAKDLSQEAIEATRSIRAQNWNNLTPGDHGLTTTNGFWEFAGTSQAIGKFTRQVNLTPGQRGSGNEIVDSGGTADPDLFKVTSTVTWNFSPTRTNSVSFITYLTNFAKAITSGWATPQQVGSLNLSGNNNGLKVQVKGNYAFVIASSGTNFYAVDISNPASPSVVGSLTLSNAPTNLYVIGSTALVSSSSNSQELQIVDISNPASPSLIGSFNASGNANGLSVYAVGNIAYLGRAGSFLTIDITTPSSPTLLGTLSLGTNSVNDIFVKPDQTYAYAATSGNNAELQIINVTTPTTPSLTSSFDASGNVDALSVTSFSNTAIIGRVGGLVHYIDVTTPASPVQISTFNAQASVNDLELFNSNNYLFAATDENTMELQVINHTALTTPVLLGSLNTSADINGVSYSAGQDRLYAVTDDNSAELIVAGPQ